jgi:hypothetical protein
LQESVDSEIHFEIPHAVERRRAAADIPNKPMFFPEKKSDDPPLVGGNLNTADLMVLETALLVNRNSK